MDTTSRLAADSVAVRIVDALVKHGVDTFFGIPGGPVCPVFEALRLNKDVKLIESRHETHAAFSAASFYYATGKVAAIVVTAGPGITNSVTGVASAFLEKIPMLIIAGDVAWASHGGCLAQNSGPEGIDCESILSSITNSQIRITNGRSAISQTVCSLNHTINTQEPSLLVVPINVAMESADDIEIQHSISENKEILPQKEIQNTLKYLQNANRPLIVLGGGTKKYPNDVLNLINTLGIPFITTPRAKGVVSENHHLSLRNGGMAASLWAKKYTKAGVDVALVLGTDLDDTSVGPTPYIGKNGKLIHVDINSQVFNRNFPTSIAINSDIKTFVSHICSVIPSDFLNTNVESFINDIHSESPFEVSNFFDEKSDRITPHRAIADLQQSFPDAMFITDIGEHMLFALHYLTAQGPQDFHIQLNLGSMGSGIAGAIGLALARTNRKVVCICGDGGMQMSGMEVLTCLKYKLPIVYAVFNDARYNMVHHGMKQIFGVADKYDTALIDFSQWANSMEIPSIIVNKGGEINKDSIDKLNQTGPILLDIRIDPEVRITSGGRVEALQHMSLLTKK